jgi:hypothetical protein
MTERGTDTRWGEPGHCSHCGADMPTGPDACIGMLPGVKEACCGHGKTGNAYVTLDDGTVLYGTDALRYMRRPTWPRA